MPNTPKKLNEESVEELQISDIEKDLEKLDQKFSTGLLSSVKMDLKLLTASVTLVSDLQKRKAVQERIKVCDEKINIVEKKFQPSGSKSTLFNSGSVKKSPLEILQEAHKQLVETEEVGASIMTNLAKQKETIIHSKDNLKKIQVKAVQSDGLLTQMSKWWRG